MSQADNLIPDFEDTEFDDREEKEKPKPRKKMKIEKEPEGAWKIQFSWKLNQHMLNLRADSIEEFRESMKELLDTPELIGMAVGAFEVAQPVLPLAPAPQPVSAPAVTPQGWPEASKEVGPLALSAIKPDVITAGPRSQHPGRTYKKWVMEFGNGALVTETLNSSLAETAANLLGKNCYARVEQTKYGYKLINVRMAA